jgi:predicted HTH domain antitoxin
LSKLTYLSTFFCGRAQQWYAQQRISQDKGAEIAGISRAEFIDELSNRRIPVDQATFEELMEESQRD